MKNINFHSLTHSLTYLFILLLIFSQLSVNAQIHCSYSKIRGPLVVNCNNTGSTGHYYLDDNVNVPGSWSVFPRTDATISTPNNIATDVTWTNTAVADHAYLIYSGAPEDTLYPQACCPPPAINLDATIIDLDDNYGGIPAVLSAFGSHATQPNPPNGPIIVNSGTYFIEGQLNLYPHTPIEFNDVTFYMGSGAVIYAANGYSTSYTINGSFVANGCSFYGTCGMWRGIVAPSDGKICFNNSTLRDAEFGIQEDGCKLAIVCEGGTTFLNNCVSIYVPSRTYITTHQSYFFDWGTPSSRFEECTFDCTTPMTLPYFNGQYCFPILEKPFAAFVVNDLIPQNMSFGNVSIPFSTSSSIPCTIQNMSNGIYAINCQVDVFNCNINNIDNFAILSDNTCSYCTSTQLLSVGDANSSGLYKQNSFDKCYYGIFTKGEVDATVLSNTFNYSDPNNFNRAFDVYLYHSGGGRNIDIQNNTFSNYRIGIALASVSNAKLNIYNNNFYGDPLYYQVPPHTGPFSSTGIVLNCTQGTVLHSNISSNYFYDSRIAMYLTGVQGTAPGSNDFIIENNYINNNISFQDLQTLYNHHFNSYGIWCDNTGNLLIQGNYFLRNATIQGAPQNFDVMLRAINVKQSLNLDINTSAIFNFGTPMRFVSNCNKNNLRCNYMEACASGIYLDLASMTTQGAPGNPWDNTWALFDPIDKISGTIPSNNTPINWYHQDPDCNSYPCSYDYAPGPSGPNIINPWPNESGPSCADIFGGGGNDKIMDIAANNITYSEYPDESRYLDKEFAFRALKTDSVLLDSVPALQSFYSGEQSGNIGMFDAARNSALNGDFAGALATLNNIVDQNNIEANKKFVWTLEFQKELNNDENFTEQETEDLSSIAWQNAWEGGDAVFEARRLLNLEVDDQEHNLKLAHRKNVLSGRSLNVFPTPSSGDVTFSSEMSPNSELRIIDSFGKILVEKNFNSGKISISDLKQGVYSAQLVEIGRLLNVQKFIIIK